MVLLPSTTLQPDFPPHHPTHFDLIGTPTPPSPHLFAYGFRPPIGSMNFPPTSPFNLVHFNAQSLPAHQLSAWQSLASSADHNPSLPTTPLLYVLVESGH